jgi:GTP1/Obg family GTP-binding protein
MIDVKQLKQAFDNANAMLNQAASQVPGHIAALGEIKKHEAEIMAAGVGRIGSVMENVKKEMQEVEDLLKLRK